MAIEDFKNRKDEYEKRGLGMIHKVDEWLEEHSITPSQIESEIVDGNKVFYIDVEGDVWLEGYHLNDVGKIPSYIKFRNVSGKFILSNNK